MLHNINWENYWLVLAVSVIVYYCFIVSIYFKDEIKSIFVRIPQRTVDAPVSTNTIEDFKASDKYETDDTPPWEESERVPAKMDTITATELFLSEIEAFFDSVENSIASQDLSDALRRLIQKYPSLNDLHLKNSLSRLLGFYCDNKCSIRFTEEELMGLWEN
jgi:hypothetical protein